MQMMTVLLVLASLGLGSPRAAAQGPAKPDAWAGYRFLIGTWGGEGTGQPGTGMGTATFKLDLDAHVLVRTSRSAYPATAQRPAFVHEDLLVTYRDTAGDGVRATYWDNEGHVIEYDVTAAADGRSVTFISKATPSAPRFRLVYTRLGPDTVDVKFEMAPPGDPGGFKVYTQGVTKKVASSQ